MACHKYITIRKRQNMLTAGYWNGIYQTSPVIKKINGACFEKFWQVYEGGRLEQIHLKKNWDKVGKLVSQRLFRDKKYFLFLKKEIEKAEREAGYFSKKFNNQDLTKFSFKELIKATEQIKKLWFGYDVFNVPAWFWGGDRFRELVKKDLGVPEAEFLTLSTPIKKTFVSQLEFDLLSAVILIKNKKSNFKKTAIKLSEEYGWIPFGYDGPEYWGKEYFVKEIKKNYSKAEKKLKMIAESDKQNLKQRQKIIKNYKLNKKQLELIDRLNYLALWTDERKKVIFGLSYCYGKILWELERRFNVPYLNLKYLLTEELPLLENKNDELLKLSEQRIKNKITTEFKNGKIKFLTPREQENFLKNIKEGPFAGVIKGFVASKGLMEKCQGRVKVLFTPQDKRKIKAGDFIVVSMTTPDYILAMKKASGFITDEGGITCHAAIVAREMKKPCIIGTKIATQVLKDGDLVEVDVKRGVVKILK